jgi:membrane protease YdiL (CAAX protease family)
MSRSNALEQAAALARQHNLGPATYQQAALFATDHDVQTYVELHAGGAKAYSAMVKGTLYSPYTWQVRHVKPLETNELILRFKPDGTFYGFVEKIAENIPGTALTPEQAELIAQRQAILLCNVQIAEYQRIEVSKEVRPNGRIDHTFVYERPHMAIGKATYRLRLVVTGDKLTEVTHFVKIPEEFYHQYKEMRSANNTLAQAANICMVIIYILGIGIIGLLYLLRRRYLLWKAPMVCGLIIALLNAGAHLSQFPLFWFIYQTTSSLWTFVSGTLLQVLINFVLVWALYTFVFMIAESLTRAALPKLGQFWKTWTRSSGSSWATLENTAAAYLLVPLFFADVVLFYRITTHYLGWWTPSEQLTDPNVLASYMPWLNAVAPSLSAGFLEECLFRAFPLAAALLLGRAYGKKNWWLAGAFILQILIFGAAHANYPAQPAYARLVELVVFSTLMGVIYLKRGLLVGIITHALYDLVWFALPIFISQAPHAWIQKSFVSIVGLLPIAIVVFRRFQYGYWHVVDAQECNCAQLAAIPEPCMQEQQSDPSYPESPTSIQDGHKKILGLVALAALVLWGSLTQFTPDAQPLSLPQRDAKKMSATALEQRGFHLDKNWNAVPLATQYGSPITHPQSTETTALNQHKFVWQTSGKSVYEQLLGSYLEQPHWGIRYLRFNGSVQERSEEYYVSIDNTHVSSFQHTLAESRPGKQLSEQDARVLAQKLLREVYGTDHKNCDEVSAISSKKPQRLDWKFTFAEKNQPPLKEGQARIAITIAGDELAGYYRYVHVPEEWLRTQDKLNERNGLIRTIAVIILLALIILFGIRIFRTRKQSLPAHYWHMSVLFFVLFLIQTINGLPYTLATVLNAQEPYWQQLFRISGWLCTNVIIVALLYPLFMSFVNIRSQGRYGSRYIWYGISLGVFWAGLSALTNYCTPSTEPVVGSIQHLNAYIPCLAIILEKIGQFLTYTVGVLFCVQSLDTLHASRHRSIVQIVLLMLLGLLIGACQPIATIPHTIIFGCILGIYMAVSYRVVLHHIPMITPWTTSTVLALSMVRHSTLLMSNSALLCNIIGIIIIFIMAWFWHKKNT